LETRDAVFAGMTLPDGDQVLVLDQITRWLTWFFVAALSAVLLARVVRRLWQLQHGVVRISYPNGRSVNGVLRTSAVEADPLARLRHASICGGRGRCSTCRVRVRAALPGLPTPSEAETRVLQRIGATPSIRLACQLRPTSEIEVTPLLPPLAQAHHGAT